LADGDNCNDDRSGKDDQMHGQPFQPADSAPSGLFDEKKCSQIEALSELHTSCGRPLTDHL